MKYDTAKDVMMSLYEQFVLRNDNFENDEGIHFCLKIDAENYGYEKDGNTYHEEWRKRSIKHIHFILLKWHKVFVSISEDDDFHGYELPEPKTWKNTSNHDSCWRSDGFSDLSQTYFKIHNEIYANTPDEHKEAPVSSDIHFHLGHGWLSGPVFKFVKVEHKALEIGNSYHRQLTKIEHIKKTIEIKGAYNGFNKKEKTRTNPRIY